jgi:hypothetical protein
MQHLRQHGCAFEREGAKHTTVHNPVNNRQSRVPRHREIKPGLVREICKQRGIPVPSGS